MCTEKSTEKPADMMRQIMDTKSKLTESTDMQPSTPTNIEMIMRQMRNTACKVCTIGLTTWEHYVILVILYRIIQGHSLSTYGDIEQ